METATKAPEAKADSARNGTAPAAALATAAVVTVQPARDLAFFDKVANHAEVYPGIADDASPRRGNFTLKPAVEDWRNVFLEVRRDQAQAGFFMLVNRAPGTYEVHTLFLPEYRGKTAVRAAMLGMDWMFLHTDAQVLTSFAFENGKAAGWLARVAGMREDCRRPHANTIKKKRVEVTWFSIGLHEWVRQAWPRYAAIGRRFNDQLAEQLGLEGVPEDKNRDGMVGLSMTMAVNGNALKAQAIYNQWAGASGQGGAQFLTQRKGVYTIDLDQAVIEIGRNLNVTVVGRKR